MYMQVQTEHVLKLLADTTCHKTSARFKLHCSSPAMRHSQSPRTEKRLACEDIERAKKKLRVNAQVFVQAIEFFEDTVKDISRLERMVPLARNVR